MPEMTTLKLSEIFSHVEDLLAEMAYISTIHGRLQLAIRIAGLLRKTEEKLNKALDCPPQRE
jgi:hypothetical protein